MSPDGTYIALQASWVGAVRLTEVGLEVVLVLPPSMGLQRHQDICWKRELPGHPCCLQGGPHPGPKSAQGKGEGAEETQSHSDVARAPGSRCA